MSKAVKCLLVDVDNVLISEVVEGFDAELGGPNCRLVNPYHSLVKVNLNLGKKQQIKGNS